jgi:hypothetical protein
LAVRLPGGIQKAFRRHSEGIQKAFRRHSGGIEEAESQALASDVIAYPI